MDKKKSFDRNLFISELFFILALIVFIISLIIFCVNYKNDESVPYKESSDEMKMIHYLIDENNFLKQMLVDATFVHDDDMFQLKMENLRLRLENEAIKAQLRGEIDFEEHCFEYIKPTLDFYREAYKEYPEATEVWIYLRYGLGYNEYVCAGILGNMMAEVGGGTLDLKYATSLKLNTIGTFETPEQIANALKKYPIKTSLDDNNAYSPYYGLCMWNGTLATDNKTYKISKDSKFYNITINDFTKFDIKTQCEFLGETIEGKFGKYYYNKFIQLNSAEEACMWFCIYYERPGLTNDEIKQKAKNRQYLATKAYDYFVNMKGV